MRMFKNVLFMALVAGLSLELVVPQTGYTQKKGKGDLEDFADDFGEEEDSDSGDSEEAIGFFIEVMFHHLVHMPQLWGGKPKMARILPSLMPAATVSWQHQTSTAVTSSPPNSTITTSTKTCEAIS